MERKNAHKMLPILIGIVILLVYIVVHIRNMGIDLRAILYLLEELYKRLFAPNHRLDDGDQSVTANKGHVEAAATTGDNDEWICDEKAGLQDRCVPVANSNHQALQSVVPGTTPSEAEGREISIPENAEEPEQDDEDDIVLEVQPEGNEESEKPRDPEA